MIHTGIGDFSASGLNWAEPTGKQLTFTIKNKSMTHLYNLLTFGNYEKFVKNVQN